MAQIETWFDQDLKKAVKVRYIDGNVFSADNNGNIIGVNVFDNGAPATIGGSVAASIIRADGVTVAASGTVSGNRVSVALPQSAYAVPGVLSVVIKLTSGSVVTTLCAVVGNVYRSTTDTVVDPGTIIPSIDNLIAEIEAAVASIPADYSALWESLAPAFSTSTAYTAGQYVTYNGGLYRFSVDHAAGSWNSAHVTAVNLGGEVYDLKSAVAEVTSYKFIERFDGTFSHIYGNVSTGKIVSNNLVNSAVVEMKNGANYKISATGMFNRFGIYVSNSVEVGASCTRMSYKDGSMTSEEYTYTNTDGFKYIIVMLSYDYPQFNCDVSICDTYGSDTAPFSVNGIRVYTAAEVDQNVQDAVDEINENGMNTIGIIHCEISDDGYLKTNGDSVDTDDVYGTGGTFRHTVIQCAEGDVFHICGKALGSVAALYAVLDSSYNIIILGNTSDTTATDEYVTMPESAAYLLVQDKTTLTPQNSVTKGLSIEQRFDEIDPKIEEASAETLASVDAKILNVSNNNYQLPIAFTTVNYSISNSKINTSHVGKMAYFSITAGNNYNISLSGVYNRFIVSYADSIENGAVCTNIASNVYSTTVQRSNSITIENAGSYAYVVVFYNYDGEGTSSNIELSVNAFSVNAPFKVNGVRVYTANETDALKRYKNYVSGSDVSVVNSTDDLYALYDQLVSDYDYCIYKNVLGTGTGNLDIVEYVITLGNYNTYSTVQRAMDREIAKDVILILTGCHGYEKTSIMSTYQFVKDLVEGNPYLANIFGNYTVKVVPVGCPYSFNNDIRTNANGVNIERNFNTSLWSSSGSGTSDYSGASAADQPETQIIQEWIDDNPDAIMLIDFHNSAYADEVSYYGGDDSVTGMVEFKKDYLRSVFACVPYLIDKLGFADDLIFAYSGNFNNYSTAYRYAIETNATVAGCLECSWNQNDTGKHSDISIKVGAEVLGNIIVKRTKNHGE